MLLKIKDKSGKSMSWRTNLEATGRAVTIGRGSDADIKVDDEKCSRIHCAIRAWDDLYIIRDMLSKNGTFVNGQTIRVSELRPDDIVTIGDIQIVLESEGKEQDLTMLEEQENADA